MIPSGETGRSGPAAILLSGILASVLVAFLSGCLEQPRVYDPERSLVGEVSGEFALAHARSLVGFGPRPTGSEALKLTRRYLEDQLGELGWGVERQVFRAGTPEGEREFINLRARFQRREQEGPVSGILATHYDTKRFESFSFVGANDGASGVAVLLELARVLRKSPALAREVELVFFDGQEALGPAITPKDGLYGSRFYAKEILAGKKEQRPAWGVLLNMVGEEKSRIRAATRIPDEGLVALARARERSGYVVDIATVRSSLQEMAKDLLAAAGDLGIRSRVGISPDYLVDDHVPLNVIAGVPTINLVDFEYPYSHTPADTLDRITAESLGIAARVALHLLEKYSDSW